MIRFDDDTREQDHCTSTPENRYPAAKQPEVHASTVFDVRSSSTVRVRWPFTPSLSGTAVSRLPKSSDLAYL